MSELSMKINPCKLVVSSLQCSVIALCTMQHPALPRCRPYGTVRLNIRTTWIQNATPDHDAMTEGSMMSSLGQQSMGSSAIGSDTVDQVPDMISCMICLHALQQLPRHATKACCTY